MIITSKIKIQTGIAAQYTGFNNFDTYVAVYDNTLSIFIYSIYYTQLHVCNIKQILQITKYAKPIIKVRLKPTDTLFVGISNRNV